jgi:hypothetical protein
VNDEAFKTVRVRKVTHQRARRIVESMQRRGLGKLEVPRGFSPSATMALALELGLRLLEAELDKSGG